MKAGKLLCLWMALALLLGGALGVAEETVIEAAVEAEPIEAAVEEVEAVLGEEAPEPAEAEPEAAEALQPRTMDAPEDAAPTDADGTEAGEPAVAAPAGPLTALSLPGEMTIGVGEQVPLRPAPTPAGATYSLTCSTNKKKYVQVAEDGVITGLKKGKSVVTAKAQNGVSVKIKVQVLAEPKTVSLQVDRTTLAVGETTTARCVLPKKTAAGWTFHAEENGVLRIAADGTITALAEGAATVYVTTSNGLTASAAVTVGKPVAPATGGAVSGPFEITFMNIGRNDGILIHCGGEWAYIDSGMRAQGVAAVEYMRAQGVGRLKYYISAPTPTRTTWAARRRSWRPSPRTR